MNLTPYHAKYFAYELTKRSSSDSVEKFASTLVDIQAQVDLNPHQVEAALFAFRSPLSKGAILADEVGLGKTIEAAILLSQFWAERKRKLLIICPANLRKQWSQELWEKFFLESIILENKNFNEFRKASKENPFEQSKIIICSYQFARAKAEMMQLVSWDLAVIDEAHRLRNVYKPDNRIGNAIKNALSQSKKALLTATPLQNSLLELYGLVSIIDEHTFGDIKSFRSQFLRNADGNNHQDLRDRLKSVCIRNLRRQVQEYIQYTARIPVTVRFEPSDEEQILYREVSEYLQRQTLYALPAGQRHLITLILRKLLASSSFAIAGTLNSLIRKLENLLKEQQDSLEEEIVEDYELFTEQEEEWEEEEAPEQLSPEDIEGIKAEINELRRYSTLAESIRHNAKGNNLQTALKEGFEKMEFEASRKAIIFTESTRTQNYLAQLLSKDYEGRIVLFNGSNNDEQSNRIYRSWLERHKGTDKMTGSPTADKRAALVDYFREEAVIMIATEAAAEGINLQFCSLVVNYDLPWNPQRIEQRIGRCHRYGQKYDVVVINFLNIRNAADVRVFQLLDEKFRLFSGVFGASDEVLGSIESGVDFEKRIAEIYQCCRNEQDIKDQFDALQQELEEQINQKMLSTREKLLANFDAEVIEKLKLRLHESQEYVSKYEQWLWNITRFALHEKATFNDSSLSFRLERQPFEGEYFPLEHYKLGKHIDSAHVYRIGHPLAQQVLAHYRNLELPAEGLTFDLTGHSEHLAALQHLKGQQGVLSARSVIVKSFEEVDYLLLTGMTDNGEVLGQELLQRLFTLSATVTSESSFPPPAPLQQMEAESLDMLLQYIHDRDKAYLNTESEKLNKWADDRVSAAERAIKDTKKRIAELNRESLRAEEPAEQLRIQEALKEQHSLQTRLRREIFQVEDEIAEQRDKMIHEIARRMKQEVAQETLFTIRWTIE